MDPISQGALGAIAGQNFAQRKHLAVAATLGLLAGLAPDLDIFFRSDTDPLLFFEYHRQFTHSLIFIPIGGLLCALLMHPVARRWGLQFADTFTYCIAGYATHGLLDACTSYGTQLYWPFTNARVSWSNISIIDPLFTLPLVILFGVAARRKKRLLVRVAALWVVFYLGLGLVQKARTEQAVAALAATRGHEPMYLKARPGFGNMLYWKGVYEVGDRYFVIDLRVGATVTVKAEGTIEKLNIKRDFPWLDPASQQAKDIERFRWFADGLLAVDPRNPNRIMDIRNFLLSAKTGGKPRGIWMIELNRAAGPDDHVRYSHEH